MSCLTQSFQYTRNLLNGLSPLGISLLVFLPNDPCLLYAYPAQFSLSEISFLMSGLW